MKLYDLLNEWIFKNFPLCYLLYLCDACLTFVLYLSYLCVLPVLPMCVTCLTYVCYMSYFCVLPVLPLCVTCLTFVCYLSYLCVLPILLCVLPILPLCATCLIFVCYLSYLWVLTILPLCVTCLTIVCYLSYLCVLPVLVFDCYRWLPGVPGHTSGPVWEQGQRRLQVYTPHLPVTALYAGRQHWPHSDPPLPLSGIPQGRHVSGNHTGRLSPLQGPCTEVVWRLVPVSLNICVIL